MRIAVDASALVAILFDEVDAELYLSKLLTAGKAWISAVNWWEVQVRVRTRYGERGETKSAAFMESIGLLVEPVTVVQAKVALDAFARYRGRPARLNMGDCFAYALAQAKKVSLLCKGDDFSRTDVETA